eukprot:TRINITY_DN355_c0_g1_i1.p1 TRINITY_DN355_c0_g1~~TRINITY_DN355_c0_g1_i1.p1  ORF type:complete len:822 (-),score=284.97 TRINITY_DN355_c0_g1_i1:176-2641(-)
MSVYDSSFLGDLERIGESSTPMYFQIVQHKVVEKSNGQSMGKRIRGKMSDGSKYVTFIMTAGHDNPNFHLIARHCLVKVTNCQITKQEKGKILAVVQNSDDVISYNSVIGSPHEALSVTRNKVTNISVNPAPMAAQQHNQNPGQYNQQQQQQQQQHQNQNYVSIQEQQRRDQQRQMQMQQRQQQQQNNPYAYQQNPPQQQQQQQQQMPQQNQPMQQQMNQPQQHMNQKWNQPQPHQQQRQGGGYQQPQQVQQQYNNSSNPNPMSMGGGSPNPLMKIADLHPYVPKFSFKARCSMLDSIREYGSDSPKQLRRRGYFLDQHGTEIQFNIWRRENVERLDFMTEGDMYLVSGNGQSLKAANPRFNVLKHQYEIGIGHPSFTVVPIGDDPNVKKANFAFEKISQIRNKPEKSVVDICAVVLDYDKECIDINTRRGDIIQKRELVLCDDSNCSIKLTLWGENAKLDPSRYENHPVIVSKSSKVSDFNGKSINGGSKFEINMNIPEVNQMANWWAMSGAKNKDKLESLSGGAGGGARPISNRNTIATVNSTTFEEEKAKFFNIKATINFIYSNREPAYKACIRELDDMGKKRMCNKKVIVETDGVLTCGRCGQVKDYTYRYILSANIVDHTGNKQFITFYDESGAKLLGMDANDMVKFKPANQEEENPQKFDAMGNPICLESLLESKAVCDSLMTLRVNLDNSQDEIRQRASAYRFEKLNYGRESKLLLDALKSYKDPANIGVHEEKKEPGYSHGFQGQAPQQPNFGYNQQQQQQQFGSPQRQQQQPQQQFSSPQRQQQQFDANPAYQNFPADGQVNQGNNPQNNFF